MSRSETALAELVGLDGAFVFPELLLQRIWLRGDFDARNLRLRDGRRIALVRRGRWNRAGGPDFSDAEVIVGEGAAAEIWRGAVEVHLRAEDWAHHRHAEDPAYAGVVLHVVLFPSREPWTLGAGGRRIPILELLPWLERDLEAYAAEAAVEGLAGRPFSRLREWLAAAPPGTIHDEVARHAERRWRHKVGLARARIARLGWDAACHHAALEVLGYGQNRAPMLAVAEGAPLSRWAAGEIGIDAALSLGGEDWRSAGVRPANQPRARLAQYARWLALVPDWPVRLARATEPVTEAGRGLAPAPLGAATGRRAKVVGVLRRWLATEVAGAVIGGTRFDTLVCDAWLPLLAAQEAEPAVEASCAALWRAWPPGDLPDELRRLAREFAIGRTPPAQGDLQGLLGWMAERRDQVPD